MCIRISPWQTRMNDTLLYQQILGLKAPWYVASVKLDEQLQTLFVDVGFQQGDTLICPKCSEPVTHYDSRVRCWRHLDTCQFQTIIRAKVPRVKCQEHNCLTLPVPWAEESSRYTELFENRVIQLLRIASIRAVSEALNLSWGAIDRIMQRAVARGLALRKKISTEHLLIDETSFKKGCDNVTVLSNRQGQVLAVADGRTQDSVRECVEQLPADALAKTKTVSMDMSSAYIRGISNLIDEPNKKIAFDHYHVAQLLTKAVDHIRKSEIKKLDAALRREAHRTRYYWLRNRNNLTDKHKQRLNPFITYRQETSLAWYFKEWAREIWHGYRVKGARKNWDEWLGLIEVTNLLPLKTVASTIKEKLWGILNAMRFGVSNALAEAINGKIRQLRIRAMGYRNKERFKTAIMFHYGCLNLTH